MKINGEEFTTVKSILCINNPLFKKIIIDDEIDCAIELFNECSVTGFKILESFYGNGIVDINESNVIDVIIICECYNEHKLLDLCVKYIMKHLNIKIIISLINNNKYLAFKSMNIVKKTIDNYIKDNYFKLLNNNHILDISAKGIAYIINIKNPKKIEILRPLLLYLQMNNSNKGIEEIIKNMKIEKDLILMLNENEINVLSAIYSIDDIFNLNIPIIDGINDKLNGFICNKFKGEINICDEDIQELNGICTKENIEVLLNEENILINIIGILIANKMKYKININREIITKLLYYYNESSNKIKNIVTECFSLIINYSIILYNRNYYINRRNM